MVCNRCKTAVKADLEQQGLHPTVINLGEVELREETISAQQLKDVRDSLQLAGFELIDNKKSRIIDKIKTLVINLVHYTEDIPKEKNSEVIAKALYLDYFYLSKLFSEVEGITIEQYIINQKVEKIKEYIVYNELTLSEIAYRMGYKSVAHLSSQFKKVTGLPPSHFKNLGAHMRKPLDKVGKQ